MARKRKTANRDLPPNLYVRNNGYYCYRDPRTGKEYGLGKEKRMAINEAISANRQIFDAPVSLTDRINEVKTLSMTEWIEQFTQKLQQRGLRLNTLKHYLSRLNPIKQAFSDRAINTLTTKEIAKFLNSYTERGKTATSKLIRSTLIDLFNGAIAEGHLETNPAAPTKNPRVQIQRARLSLEEFLFIRQCSHPRSTRIKFGMNLALLTGQRLGDIQQMQWQDIHDGKWWLQQEKTGMKLAIPLTLNLEAIEETFEGILNQCREQIGGEKYVLIKKGKDTPASARLSEGFKELRKKSGLKWEGTPPSFHEIRSLSARLYSEAKGKEFAQKLLGHKSANMTDKYRDSRGSEWETI
ncbi:site-specific integrase [Candidatus Williamhamiltonella defendens]|uniref:Integrase n=1 Tax=Candidatus Williamhamiltonella defendens TaxID=138072 RepID=A0A2D3TBD9_9ENTR|nr:tyrosine-type recombinase/integrase [Candidatus Hamiltonella defensa]ATW33106.1 integrase [Candidatus Hamiltonella defensa]